MYDYTDNNWCHRNSNKRFKEKSGRHSTDSLQKTATLGTELGRLYRDNPVFTGK